MELIEIPIKKETVYKGIIVNIRQDDVKLIDGTVTKREVVEHPGGAAVLAIDSQNRVVLVKQYRYPVENAIFELPAGKLEAGEAPEVCARRELMEETGITADDWTYLGISYSSPGIIEETIHLYLARDLTQGASCCDEGEFVDVEWFPFSDLLDMVRKQEIVDGKTIAGIMKGFLILKEDDRK